MPVNYYSKLKIRKQPNVNLYKVYDEGKALSKRGLSKPMAERQRTAVILSGLRKQGSIPPIKPMKSKSRK
jgi:hypothetical protein